MLSYVERWVKLIPLKSPKIGSWKKTFLSLDLSISNVLQIGETRVSKFEFMHTLSQTISISEIKQKAIVSCFVKSVAFLLEHPVVIELNADSPFNVQILVKKCSFLLFLCSLSSFGKIG